MQQESRATKCRTQWPHQDWPHGCKNIEHKNISLNDVKLCGKICKMEIAEIAMKFGIVEILKHLNGVHSCGVRVPTQCVFRKVGTALRLLQIRMPMKASPNLVAALISSLSAFHIDLFNFYFCSVQTLLLSFSLSLSLSLDKTSHLNQGEAHPGCIL